MAQNRETNRKSVRNYYWKRRRAAIAALGGKCVRCGFSDIRALQIDHVNGGGVKELGSMSHRRTAYHLKIAADQTGYQLLCANCNWIKRAENEETRRL